MAGDKIACPTRQCPLRSRLCRVLCSVVVILWRFRRGPVPEPSHMAIRLQLAALAIAGVAALFGAFCVYQAAFPGPCGDDPGPVLGVMEAWLVDAPLGLLTLAAGFFVRKGLPVLRGICVLAAFGVLSFPVVASLFLQRWHCP